jgi:hypothetical protein
LCRRSREKTWVDRTKLNAALRVHLAWAFEGRAFSDIVMLTPKLYDDET